MRRGVSTSVKGAGVIISLLFIFGLAYAGSVASTKSPSTTASQTSTSSALSTNTTQTLQKLDSDIGVTLTVKAYHAHHQRPYYDQNMSEDLILNNFNNMLGAFLSKGSSASSISWTAQGITGGLSTAGFDTYPGCGTVSGATCGAFFEIGTSGTAPTRTDTALNSPYTPSGGNVAFPDTAENAAPTTSPTAATCTEGTTDYVGGISGSQVVTGSESFQEVGLFIGVTNDYGAGVVAAQSLMMHDTYPTISAVAGDSVTVSYQLDLSNAGFNDNLCTFLALVFTGNIAATGHVSGTFESVGAVNTGFYLWCSADSYAQVLDALVTSSSCGSASPVGQLGLGTSTSSVSTSSYKLGTMVGGYGAWATDANPTSPGGTIYLTSSLTISGSNTITEAGMFLELSSTEYMFVRITFSGQAQSSGVPFGMTLRIED